MIFYHINYILTSQKGTQAISLSILKISSLLYYQTTLNIFCFKGLSSISKIPISFLAFSNPCIFWSSFSASSSPTWVYTLSVTAISECPIKYCSVLGFMPDFAILEQYVCLQTWGVILGINKKSYTERYQWWILPSMTLSTSNPLIHLPFKWKEDKNNSSNHVSKYASFTIPINFLNSLFMKSAYY